MKYNVNYVKIGSVKDTYIHIAYKCIWWCFGAAVSKQTGKT